MAAAYSSGSYTLQQVALILGCTIRASAGLSRRIAARRQKASSEHPVLSCRLKHELDFHGFVRELDLPRFGSL